MTHVADTIRKTIKDYAVNDSAYDVLTSFMSNADSVSEELYKIIGGLEDRKFFREGLVSRLREIAGGSPQVADEPTVEADETVEEPPKKRRRRRTKAEMEAFRQGQATTKTARKQAKAELQPVSTHVTNAMVEEARGDVPVLAHWEDPLYTQIVYQVLKARGFELELDARLPGGSFQTASKLFFLRLFVRARKDAIFGIRKKGIVGRYIEQRIDKDEVKKHSKPFLKAYEDEKDALKDRMSKEATKIVKDFVDKALEDPTGND